MSYTREDRRKVRIGTLINVAGGISMISFRAFQFVLRHLFGGEAFGLYAIAYGLMELLSNFVLGGFGDAVTYHVAPYIQRGSNESESERLKREKHLYTVLATALRGSFLISIILSGFLIGGAEYLHYRVWRDHSPELISLLHWVLAALPLFSLNYMLAESTRAHLDMRTPVLIMQILFPITSILLSLAWHFWFKTGILSMAYGLLLSLAVCLPVSIMEFRRYYSIHKMLKALFLGKNDYRVWRFAIPQSLNMASNAGLVKMDALMLSAYVPANSVGIYSLLVDLSQLIRMPKMAFSGIFGPLVARYQNQRNTSGIQDSLREIALITGILGSITFLAVQFFFADFILGPNARWNESFWVPWLVCVGPFMSAHFGLAGNLLLMSGHARLLLINSLAALSFNLLLNWMLIPQYGLLGAALSGAIANFTISVLQICEMNHLEKISFGWTLHLRTWIGIALSLGTLWYSRELPWEQRLLWYPISLASLILPRLITNKRHFHPISRIFRNTQPRNPHD